ncbi:MAG TPA: AzlD domain-containing protein [Usitatibacter sp.]|nr:AzlD domain-containing protein [Usitatibacter sp.]
MSTWIAIAGVALSTFLLRASFMLFVDPHRFPHWFRQALKFVPPSVLAAIVAPGLLMAGGALDLSPSNLRLAAGLVAMAATFHLRNTFAAVATGMATLWALQWALGRLG